METQQLYTIRFARAFSKLYEPAFSTIRFGHKPVAAGDRVLVAHRDGKTYRARVLLKHVKALDALPDEFLLQDTDTVDRAGALAVLRGFYPSLKGTDLVTVLRVEYIDIPRRDAIDANVHLECYISVIDRFRAEHPDAHFEIVTRQRANSPLSPSWPLLSLAKAREITFEEYNKRLRREILGRPEAIERLRALRAMAARGQPVFLVCFEKDPSVCHRSLVKQLVMEMVE